MENKTYRNDELEAQVTTTLRTISQKSGLAANGRHSSKDGLCSMFIGSHQMAKSLMDTVDSRLLVETNRHAAGRRQSSRGADEEELRKSITMGEERAITLAAYAKEPAGALRRAMLSLLIAAITLADSIWNQRGYEILFSLPYYMALGISVVTAMLMAFVAHDVVPKYVRGGLYTQRMRNVMAVAAGIFLLLGIMRTDGIPTTVNEALKVLAFMVLSSVAYFVACLIGIRLHDMKATLATDQEAQAARELREVRAAVKKAKHELVMLKKTAEEQTAYTEAITEYGKGLKSRIKNECISIFFEYLKIAYNNRQLDVDESIFDFREYPFSFNGDDNPTGVPGAGKIISAVLLLFTLGLASCADPNNRESDVALTVLVDRTVPLERYPSAPELLRLSGLDKDIFLGIRMEFGTIGDVDYGPTYIHTLEPARRWMSNINERTDTVKAFGKNITGSLASVTPPYSGEPVHTIFYRNVARHALALGPMPYRRKILLVYSDCQNHDESVSLYGRSGKKLLAAPDKLETRFMEQVPLDNRISGVEIYFIYQPSGFSKNEEYRAASEFFASLFSKYGAVTHITADTP